MKYDRLKRSMWLQFATFHSANSRPYSLAVTHCVRYYTASEYRILRTLGEINFLS